MAGHDTLILLDLELEEGLDGPSGVQVEDRDFEGRVWKL